jgi:hypothetical protein
LASSRLRKGRDGRVPRGAENWNEDSEPVENIIETFIGELMDEVEKELIFWER